MKLYNSLSKKIEPFDTIHPKHLRMYNCGPTVYSYAHIGNFRSFIVADILRRIFEYKGYKITQVVNITDVGHLSDDGDEGEDKLEVASKKEKKHPLDIARFYTDAFIRDWNVLNLREPEFRPKATETIPEMIAVISELIDKGFAYESGGNIYYDITKFPEYGKLSGNTIEKLTKNRVDADNQKRNPQDFVLWFSNSKFKNHILKWDSPWGEGYPGWHIECSCMSAKFLSNAFDDGFDPKKFETIDIHTGGEDNKFPHHECEIAQTEGATGIPFAKSWLHVRHLMCEGEKMSKSLGNFYYVNSLVEEGFNPRSIRYLLLSTHYRQQLNFTKEGLVASMKALEKLDDVYRKLLLVRKDITYNEPLSTRVREMVLAIEESLDDDLNVSGALGALFEGVKDINIGLQNETINKHLADEIISTFERLDILFGFFDFSQSEVPPEVGVLLEKRLEARAKKDWSASDELRNKILALGFEVLDTPQGQQVKKMFK